MKKFLIIPLGGLGKRFYDAGYKTYKPFLKVSKKDRVVDNIINNFPKKDTHVIIIGNEKKFNFISSNLNVKKISFIKIKNHKYGPVYSLFLAQKSIRKVIKDNNFFVAYSDINWRWNFKDVESFVKNKNIVIFSHKGFHPHLETNSKSDFFLHNKKDIVNKVSKKKLLINDYKKNNLAVGCYFFKSFDYFEKFFDIKKIKTSKIKNEIYIIDLLEFLLSNKIKINYFDINKFVHLGLPIQYENYLFWQRIIKNKNKNNINLKSSNIMLMGGKGIRVKDLGEKKPFLKFQNKNIYEFIFSKFRSKSNLVITNKNYIKQINKKFKINKIKETNSMFETIKKSVKFLSNKKNFFILSCDCFGNFNHKYFKKFIKSEDPDIVVFPFKISDLQRTITNSHTTIEIIKTKLSSINVKKFINNKNEFGHAGFFWVKDNQVFNNIEKFIFKMKFNREILLDDYFKFLFDEKICKVNYFMLDEYVHIGSVKEYFELKYWEKYFKNEN